MKFTVNLWGTLYLWGYKNFKNEIPLTKYVTNYILKEANIYINIGDLNRYEESISYFDVESYSLHPHLGKKDLGCFFPTHQLYAAASFTPCGLSGFLGFFREEELEMIPIASSWTQWVR